jgi:hypothetical protein
VPAATGPVDHRPRELWLGRELDVVGDAGAREPVGVGAPGLRQVQRSVDERMPARGGVGEVDRDLRVLDAPGRTGVLALHPHGGCALLQIPGLVQHEDRIIVTEMPEHVGAHVVPGPVRIPHSTAEQVLQPVRRPMAGMLGDCPAVLALQRRDQPGDEISRVRERLTTGEPARDPTDSGRELRLPPTGRYAVSAATATGDLFHTSNEP